jgi:hypothetical protein
MRYLKKITIVLIFSALQISAQNLDSVYNSFINLFSHSSLSQNVPNNILGGPSEQSIKCGFSLANEVKLNFEEFTSDQQKVLSTLATRFDLETSIVTPGGFFRIHYDTQGNDKPSYDINLLAQALDSTYNFEILKLGYPIPPSDFGNSTDTKNPDDLYDVYVLNIGNTYGWTQPGQLDWE